MIRNYRYIIPVVLTIIGEIGCDDLVDDLKACHGDEGPVTITITTPAPTAAPTAEFTVKGTLKAEVRIQDLRVAGVRATGLRDNFGEWEAKVPIDVLYSLRNGEASKLTAVAVDVCDGEHSSEPLAVPLQAPPGSSPAGLEILVTAAEIGGCYIPANGSARAKLTLEAAADTAGMLVQLAPSKGVVSSATAVGGPVTSVILVGDGKQAASATAELRVSDGQDDTVTVVAAAGTVSLLSSGITVAGAPTIISPPDAPEREQVYPLYVATVGRLYTCQADVSHTGAAIVRRAKDKVSVLGEPVGVGQGATCGQKIALEVVFANDAPDFAFVTVACEDVFGQRARHEVFLAAAADAESTGP